MNQSARPSSSVGPSQSQGMLKYIIGNIIKYTLYSKNNSVEFLQFLPWYYFELYVLNYILQYLQYHIVCNIFFLSFYIEYTF